jgi:Tol biopolymer transport system component/DNA-binding winged helix-turn-helix (wHTH) protein
MASPGTQQGIIRFGPFELDPVNRELRKRGIPVKLQPQQFAVLWVLAHRAGQVVSRDEIHQHIWGTDTFVDFERGINFSINQIRAALGDDAANPRFIETIPRRGYRFIAAVENGEPRESASATPATQIEHDEPAGAAASVTPISGDRSGDRKSTASADQEQVSASSDVRAALPARLPFATKILVALALLLTVSVGFLGYRAVSNRAGHRARTPARSAFPNMRITQLTSLPGEYRDPAFSPDGKQIAFIWDGENPVRGDLYLQWVGGEKPLRLTHTSTGRVCCADWSPDGRQIIFGRCDDNGGGVYTIPALGGSERKLTDVVCQYGYGGGTKWTADGKSLVLADSCAPGAPPGIVVFSLQTGEKRCLHSPPAYDEADRNPTLSPDQRTVAFLRGGTGKYEINTVAFSGGNLRQLTKEGINWTNFTLMWSPDGKYIAYERSDNRMARIPVSGGPIEFNPVYPRIGALSGDGRRLAYLEPAEAWRSPPMVWRANPANAGGKVVSQSRVLVSATGNSSAQLSPSEQQLVFESREQIWKSKADGSDPLQLTFFETGFPGTPRWSPDEKWIAFDYRSATQRGQIYLVDSEGRNLRRLSSDDSHTDCVPSWSRDGKAVYFASNRSGDWQVWRREISTGKETQITQRGGFAAFESYDAKTLYYSKFDHAGIWKMPVRGGQEVLVTDSLHLGYWGHFAVTDNGLYLVDADAKGGPTLMYYNFKTRRTSPILTFEKTPVPWTPNLAASRDGRTLLYAQVEFENSTISMAENFQ